MSSWNPLRRRWVVGWMVGGALLAAGAQTPISEVLAGIDTASGKPKEAGKRHSVRGVVGARLVLPDSRTVAWVLAPGEPALRVFAPTPAAAAALLPRNEVSLSGVLAVGPLGPGLELDPTSVTLSGTNKPFGASELRGADFFADASTLAGRYVQLTNVTFVGEKFDATGIAKVKSASGAEVVVRVGKAAAGREVPRGAQDVFGFVVPSAG
ncbi:MAG: hypothetical protein JNL97_05035, partial [Verrucomicrobiales bacterium]|nr:hypothetical protein [Verrucomicrobiales bacterium]